MVTGEISLKLVLKTPLFRILIFCLKVDCESKRDKKYYITLINHGVKDPYWLIIPIHTQTKITIMKIKKFVQ